jgi:hypothetical protein
VSLTSFLKIPAVKAVFAQEFPLPTISLSGDMVARPVTRHYSLIGTAFDYLLRFYLERLNPNSITAPGVARQGVALASEFFPKEYERAKKSLEEAERLYADFIKTGRIEDGGILRAAILLAQLDPIYRALVMNENMGIVEDGDMQDLTNLVKAVKPELFKSDYQCLLNPTFGEASQLVGGADADLIIDGKLIDIKTTVKLEFSREHYNQLVGYYILSRIGSIPGFEGGRITDMGIYYSRYGVLKSISTKSIEEHPRIDKFTRWFTESALSVFHTEKKDA